MTDPSHSSFPAPDEILDVLRDVPSFPMTDAEILQLQGKEIPPHHQPFHIQTTTSRTPPSQSTFHPSRTHTLATPSSPIIMPHSITKTTTGPLTLKSSISIDAISPTVFQDSDQELDDLLSERQLEILANTPQSIISLNLSGRVFSTTSKTLLKYRSSFFINLFDSQFKILRDSDNYIFIDRSPDYFAIILNFLRTGNILVKLKPTMSMDQLQLEVEYFGLSHVFKPQSRIHIARPFNEGYYAFDFEVVEKHGGANHFFAIALFPAVQKLVIWDGKGTGQSPWFPPFAITEVHEFTRTPPYRTRPYSLTKSSNGTTILLIGTPNEPLPNVLEPKTVFGKFVAEGEALIFHNNSCRFKPNFGGSLPGCPFSMRFRPWKT